MFPNDVEPDQMPQRLLWKLSENIIRKFGDDLWLKNFVEKLCVIMNPDAIPLVSQTKALYFLIKGDTKKAKATRLFMFVL